MDKTTVLFSVFSQVIEEYTVYVKYENALGHDELALLPDEDVKNIKGLFQFYEDEDGSYFVDFEEVKHIPEIVKIVQADEDKKCSSLIEEALDDGIISVTECSETGYDLWSGDRKVLDRLGLD